MRMEVNGKTVICDHVVSVVYDKWALDSVIVFYLRWVAFRRATATAPAEGGHWETVAVEGPYFDDDYPDLEQEAHTIASEQVEDYLSNLCDAR